MEFDEEEGNGSLSRPDIIYQAEYLTEAHSIDGALVRSLFGRIGQIDQIITVLQPLPFTFHSPLNTSNGTTISSGERPPWRPIMAVCGRGWYS